jgi:hypothetical protein
MPAVVETGNERFPDPEGYASANGHTRCDHLDVLADASERTAFDRRTDVKSFADWALALGRSVIAFGRIEHSATLMIRQSVPEGLGHKAARLDLSARLGYIDNLLRHCGLTTQEERHWRRIYRKIDGLRAQYRTILSYGAPLPGPVEFTGKYLIIRASRNAQQSLLTLAQIQLAAEQMAAAHAEFVQAATEILTRLAAQDRLPVAVPPPIAPDAARRRAGRGRRNSDLDLASAGTPAPVSRRQSGQIAGKAAA